jgi:hypothetical protein
MRRLWNRIIETIYMTANAVLATAILVGLSLVALQKLLPDLVSKPHSAELAAWVQAIGSIIAVFVAVGAAAWQSHASRTLVTETAQADMRRRVTALLGLLGAANEEIWRCRRFLLRLPSLSAEEKARRLARPHYVNPFEADFARLDEVMAAIPLYELPRWKLAEAVMDMRATLHRANINTVRLRREIREGVGHERQNPLVPDVDAAKQIILLAYSEASLLLGETVPHPPTEWPNDPDIPIPRAPSVVPGPADDGDMEAGGPFN